MTRGLPLTESTCSHPSFLGLCSLLRDRSTLTDLAELAVHAGDAAGKMNDGATLTEPTCELIQVLGVPISPFV